VIPSRLQAQSPFFCFIDVIKGDELPTEIQVLPYGNFETTNYPPFTLNEAVYDAMIRNFADAMRAEIRGREFLLCS
jgi:hypothetical protein